jgi:hypothetical protein
MLGVMKTIGHSPYILAFGFWVLAELRLLDTRMLSLGEKVLESQE